MFIELSRRFVEWHERDGELSDPEVYVHFGLDDKAKGWSDLRKSHMVVALAEAGKRRPRCRSWEDQYVKLQQRDHRRLRTAS